MGNTSPNTTATHLKPALTPRGSTSSRLSNFNKPSSIYNEILKDAEKLRQADKKLNYNPHRRVQSIASNLPSQLQNYSNSIHIVNEFWLNCIQPLPENELNEVLMVCYCRLYLKCKNVRKILLASHGIKVFNVFGYVIRNLVDPSNHLKLFKQLQVLGNMHRGYELTNDIYELFLDAFNYSMEETFQSDYKIRTRFCFGQLYHVIVDIMTGDDFYSFTRNLMTQNEKYNKPLSPILRLKRLSSLHRDKRQLQSAQPMQAMHGCDTSSSSNINEEEFDDYELNRLQLQSPQTKKKKRSFNYSQIDRFLGSLEECLSDEMGSLYFKKYLEEQFCVENFLFHQFVLKYKTCKSKQRIKLGQEIIDEFVQIGSEKEVNLSYNTRKQILTIVSLVHKMNENKEKYQQIYNKNKEKSTIMSEDDMKYLNNEFNPSETSHYRMATTKQLPLELFEITNVQNEDIPDLIYSMGFTINLFDKAYDEIFNLMRINFWSNFRNAILEFVDDDEFVKLQKEKLLKRKEEQRNMGGMIQVINCIQKTMNKNNNSQNNTNDIPSLRGMLSRVDSTNSNNGHEYYSNYPKLNNGFNNNNQNHNNHNHISPPHIQHKRRKSKDDFEINYKQNFNININVKPQTKKKRIPRFDVKISPLAQLSDHEMESKSSDTENEHENVNANQEFIDENETDSESDNEARDDILDENMEINMRDKVIKKRKPGVPRLSFIPSLMPSIEKSVTSPTLKHNSAIDTPNGGAAVIELNDCKSAGHKAEIMQKHYRNLHQNNGSYSPSELFNLVSSTIPWDYSNNVNHATNNVNKNANSIHSQRKSSKSKKKSMIIPYNKKLPLYLTHKKRQSKIAKRNSLKQPIASLCNLSTSV